MVTTSTPKHLSDRQLAAMLELAVDDGVELKVTVPESHRRERCSPSTWTRSRRRSASSTSSTRPISRSNKHGLVVRARRIQGRGDDSVVKLRPVVPHEPPEIGTPPTSTVEVDALPGGLGVLGRDEALDGARRTYASMHDGAPMRKLFSKEQRQFFPRMHLPEWSIDDLSAARADPRAEAAKARSRRLSVASWSPSSWQLPRQLDDPRAVDEIGARMALSKPREKHERSCRLGAWTFRASNARRRGPPSSYLPGRRLSSAAVGDLDVGRTDPDENQQTEKREHRSTSVHPAFAQPW